MPTTLEAAPISLPAVTPPATRADRVLLHNLSWQQFEAILAAMGQTRAARVAYDRGSLEIMTPLPEHEFHKEAISIAVQDSSEALDINYQPLGSTTWKLQLAKAGVEADNCFYFQNEPKIRGRLDIDLERGDPPPDLVLEIDLTSKSLNRFPIYARLGVPEIWCYEAGELRIFHLETNADATGEPVKGYVQRDRSLALPMLPIAELIPLLDRHRNEGWIALRRAVRTWAKTAAEQSHNPSQNPSNNP